MTDSTRLRVGSWSASGRNTLRRRGRSRLILHGMGSTVGYFIVAYPFVLFVGKLKDIRLAWVKFTLHAFDYPVTNISTHIPFFCADNEISHRMTDRLPRHVSAAPAGKFKPVF